MKKHLSFLTMALFLSGAVFYTACQKEDITTEQTPPTQTLQTEGKYKQEITLKDDSGGNWMKILVSANSMDVLNDFDVSALSLRVSENGHDNLPTGHDGIDVGGALPAAVEEKSALYCTIVEVHQAEKAKALIVQLGEASDQGGLQERAISPHYWGQWSNNCGLNVYISSPYVLSVLHRYRNNCGSGILLTAYSGFANYYGPGHFWWYNTGTFWGVRVYLDVWRWY